MGCYPAWTSHLKLRTRPSGRRQNSRSRVLRRRTSGQREARGWVIQISQIPFSQPIICLVNEVQMEHHPFTRRRHLGQGSKFHEQNLIRYSILLGSRARGQTRTTHIRVMGGQKALTTLGMGVLAQDVLTIPRGSAVVELGILSRPLSLGRYLPCFPPSPLMRLEDAKKGKGQSKETCQGHPWQGSLDWEVLWTRDSAAINCVLLSSKPSYAWVCLTSSQWGSNSPTVAQILWCHAVLFYLCH